MDASRHPDTPLSDGTSNKNSKHQDATIQSIGRLAVEDVSRSTDDFNGCTRSECAKKIDASNSDVKVEDKHEEPKKTYSEGTLKTEDGKPQDSSLEVKGKMNET